MLYLAVWIILQNEFQVSLAELFISRILQSRNFQRDVLFEVLRKFRRISETEFSMLSRDGLCKEILAVVEAEVSCLALSIIHSVQIILKWSQFFRKQEMTSLIISWHGRLFVQIILFYGSRGTNHLVYTGTIGIIRHHSLSIRRSLTEFEKYYASKLSSPNLLLKI